MQHKRNETKMSQQQFRRSGRLTAKSM